MRKCVCVCVCDYPEPTSALRPALMKQQKHTPFTIAERSTILDPILWAYSSESCLIVFPFYEVALCVCACACKSLFMCGGWYSCVKLYWVCFFFPLKGKRLIPGMCDKSHLHPLLSSEPSFDWSGLLRTLSHITKYDTLKNIGGQTHTDTHIHTHHSGLEGQFIISLVRFKLQEMWYLFCLFIFFL